MQNVKNRVPQVRFEEFGYCWNYSKLQDVSNYSNGGSFENHVSKSGRYELITLKSVNAEGRLVSSERYINIKVSTLVKDTIVMILSEQSPGLLGMTAIIPCDNKYVLNQRVAEIRPHKGIVSYFLSMAINRNQCYFGRHGAGTKVQNLSKQNVENYIFLLPLNTEQQKIGSYFQEIDEAINLHQQKHEKLVALKKAMLQKMFPQNGATTPEIRFKGFSGEWDKKKLGDEANLLTGKPFESKKFTSSGYFLVRGINVKRGIIDSSKDIAEYWPTSYLSLIHI